MSADHRKPVVAFVALAIIAAALIGVQRADAQNGTFFAAFVGGTGESHGSLRSAEAHAAAGGSLGPAFDRLADGDANISSPAADAATRDARVSDGVRKDSSEVSRGGSGRRPEAGEGHAEPGRSVGGAGVPSIPHAKGAGALERGQRDLARSHRDSLRGSRRAADAGLEAVRRTVGEIRSGVGVHGRLERGPRNIGDRVRRLTEQSLDVDLLGR
jgi:hypothetical protein